MEVLWENLWCYLCYYVAFQLQTLHANEQQTNTMVSTSSITALEEDCLACRCPYPLGNKVFASIIARCLRIAIFQQANHEKETRPLWADFLNIWRLIDRIVIRSNSITSSSLGHQVSQAKDFQLSEMIHTSHRTLAVGRLLVVAMSIVTAVKYAGYPTNTQTFTIHKLRYFF